MSETYPMPAHGWTCFHCGETFTTPGAARLHFGVTPDKDPGCILKVGVGAERGLLSCIRKLEDRLAKHLHEDSDTHRIMVDNQQRQSEALRVAEELGYERGIRDTDQTPRLLAVAKGCLDYGGGYRGGPELDIFHHGIETVIRSLEAAAKRDPNDTQVNALERIGRQGETKS